MFPHMYSKLFQTPEFHQPPEDAQLSNDVHYPNLNSKDYIKRPSNRTVHMYDAWECICLNEEDTGIIGTNQLSGSEWTGSVWGFENIKVNSVMEDKACFKLQCSVLISDIKFVSKNIFLMALHSGELQIWSTYSDVRNDENPYCLFQFGNQCEHVKPITCMDLMKANKLRAITGSKDYSIRIWNLDGTELNALNAYRYAHTDSITGVDTSFKDEQLFASCSLDKSSLLWDMRQTRPATSIFSNHNVRFTTVVWGCATETLDDNIIYLADEVGVVSEVDRRRPREFLKTTKYMDCSIRKILPNEQKLAIIGDTNTVKITSAVNHQTIYENSDATNFVRNGVWRSTDELWTVGYERKLRLHKIEKKDEGN